jgi:hypothetical protein
LFYFEINRCFNLLCSKISLDRGFEKTEDDRGEGMISYQVYIIGCLVCLISGIIFGWAWTVISWRIKQTERALELTCRFMGISADALLKQMQTESHKKATL